MNMLCSICKHFGFDSYRPDMFVECHILQKKQELELKKQKRRQRCRYIAVSTN